MGFVRTPLISFGEELAYDYCEGCKLSYIHWKKDLDEYIIINIQT